MDRRLCLGVSVPSTPVWPLEATHSGTVLSAMWGACWPVGRLVFRLLAALPRKQREHTMVLCGIKWQEWREIWLPCQRRAPSVVVPAHRGMVGGVRAAGDERERDCAARLSTAVSKPQYIGRATTSVSRYRHGGAPLQCSVAVAAALRSACRDCSSAR